MYKEYCAIVFLTFSLLSFSQSIDFEYDTICPGKVSTLKAVTSITDEQILDLAWDLNNDNYYNDAYGKIVNTSLKSTSVSLRIVTINDTLYLKKNITFLPEPLALYAFLPACDNDTFRFLNYSNPIEGNIIHAIWNFGDGDSLISTEENVVHIYKKAGSYKCELHIVNSYNCTTSYEQDLVVYEKPDFSIQANQFCIGDSTRIIYNGSINGISSLKWNFGDEKSSSLLLSSIEHFYSEKGKYMLKLEAETNEGCKSSDSVQIEIFEKPSLNLELTGDTVIYRGATIEAFVDGIYDEIKWSTGENTNKILITHPGSYEIEVIKDQCSASKKFSIVVKEKIVAPELQSSIITMNGDGINESINFPEIMDYPPMSIRIFNFKGIQIYSEKQFTNQWDMTYQNRKIDSGAYYYILESDNYVFKGNFNVLK